MWAVGCCWLHFSKRAMEKQAEDDINEDRQPFGCLSLWRGITALQQSGGCVTRFSLRCGYTTRNGISFPVSFAATFFAQMTLTALVASLEFMPMWGVMMTLSSVRRGLSAAIGS